MTSMNAPTVETPMHAPRTPPALVAFFLPQYHPDPVNDDAWGPGFTEWHTVTRARPRFDGHVQPLLPADLGFYDLRLADTRMAQADLARRSGLAAFCWYHYWFDGRRLLNEPFDRMRRSTDEDFPFLLCWANESWTRNWSGRSGSTIVQQRYSEHDDVAHARWLADNALGDPRQFRVDGRPVLLVYQPTDLPQPRRTCDTIRRVAGAAGVGEPILLAVSSFRSVISDATSLGFDGVVEQQPDLNVVRPRWRAAPRWAASRVGLVRHRYPEVVTFPYDALVSKVLADRRPEGDRWRTVCPRWDNTPRRARGAVVLTGSTPERYEGWLTASIDRTDKPIVFVNSWNEWGEGAHLEPDSHWGRAYLDATRRAAETPVAARRRAGWT
jgi:lipopolysaccharide biosynthesis protein